MPTTTDRRRAAAAAALALTLIASTAMSTDAQTTRQAPPPPTAERPFEFPAWDSQTLPNGLTVLMIEDHRQPLVSFTLVLGAGGAVQPPGKAGLAEMTAALLDKGTATRSAQDIARSIDRVGGSLAARAEADVAEVNVTVLKTSMVLGLELLADVVTHPAFKDDEVERLRRQALSGLQVQFADAEFVASAVARRVTYGTHPYAIGGAGTPETIRALTRDDIVAFHKAHYVPGGAWLAVAGDVTSAEVLPLIRQHLGEWSGKAPVAKVGAPAAPSRRAVFVDRADLVQTQLRIGTLAVPRNHPDYLPLLIANQAFGGSFNSRLNLKLRAAEGLTYGARSGMDADRHAGRWLVSTFTRTEETARAVSMMDTLLRELRENPITDAELDEAQAFLVGSFAIDAETPAQVADKVLEAQIYGLPPDYWLQYRERLRAVTKEQIAAAVRRHLVPERMELVAVGNAAGFAKDVAGFGTPEIVTFTDLDLTAPDLRRPSATTSAATPERRAAGKAVIDRAVAAAGGLEKLAAVKDVTTRGTVKLATPMGEVSGETVAEVLYPDKSKSVTKLAMGEVVQAYDGGAGWMKMGPQPPMDLPPMMVPELRRGIVTALGIDLLRKAAAGEAEVHAIEPAEVEGGKVDGVAWSLGDVQMRVYFDPSTHLLSKLAYRGVSPQGAMDVEVRVSDFREVEGLKVPFKVVGFQNGQQYLDLTVSGVTFNSGIDPAGFQKQ